jgi:hypothetical protein
MMTISKDTLLAMVLARINYITKEPSATDGNEIQKLIECARSFPAPKSSD